MGVYLNPGNVDFQKSLNSEIYIDKTELIAYTNKKLNTEQGTSVSAVHEDSESLWRRIC